jgi:hypothetical protein
MGQHRLWAPKSYHAGVAEECWALVCTPKESEQSRSEGDSKILHEVQDALEMICFVCLARAELQRSTI